MQENTTELACILDKFGPYPLHRAAEVGRKDVLEKLLALGYSANVSNEVCQTPLHPACLHGRVDIAGLLIEHGAKINAQCIDGSTPLCDACSSGSIACVELLMSHGARVNPPFVFTSPMHEAALYGNCDCLEIIIGAGGKLEASDCHYGTALHAATQSKKIESMRTLLKAGSNVNATKIHQTPLHIAATEDNFEAAKLLLEFGGNVYASNNQEKRPRDLVPKPESSLHPLLLFYESTPAQLKDLCRRKIRLILIANKALPYLDQLQLPTYLVNYVKYNC